MSDFISVLAKAKVNQDLVQSRDLIQSLLKSSLPPNEKVEALHYQVKLARERGQQSWLNRVARDAERFQFHSTQWISENIAPLPKKKAKTTSQQEALSPARDIRLKSNPDLERVTLDMASTSAASTDSPAHAESSHQQEMMEVDKTLLEIEEVISGQSWAKQVEEEMPFPEQPEKEQPRPSAVVSEELQHAAAAQPAPVAAKVSRDVTPPPREAPAEAELRRSPRKHPRSTRTVGHGPAKPHGSRNASPPRGNLSKYQQDRRRHSPASSKRAAEKRRASPVGSRDQSRDRREKKNRSDVPRDNRGPRYSDVVKKGQQKKPTDFRSAAAPSASSIAGQATPASSKTGKASSASSRAGGASHASSTAGSAAICPISGCGQAVTKNHAFDQHLPGIFQHQKLTENVTTQRIGALKLCAKWILGFPDLEHLVRYVNALHIFHQKEIDLSKTTVDSAIAVCQMLSCTTPAAIDYAPINSPGLLVHWKIVLRILSCLEEKNRLDLHDLFPALEEVMSEEGPEAFDSHFHLDRTAYRVRRPISDLVEINRSQKPDDEFQVKVTGGVAVFCDPETYPTEDQVALCRRQGLVVAIGLHPKTTPTDDNWRQFGTCLGYPGVTAFGEVGLDYSVAARQWSQQHIMLNRALTLLRPDHVLVLHSRSPKEIHDGSSTQLLYQLKGIVPKDQPIHLHCFNGDKEAVDRWVAEFPNVHFGFTAMVKDFPRDSKQALRCLDPNRLLLETDAPFFRIGGRHFSTPALLGMVASLVAEVREEDWRDVLQLASTNARRLYRADQ